MVLISLSLQFLLKLVYQLHLLLVFKKNLSTSWVLVIYPLPARTRVAFNKRVLSGGEFKMEKDG